MKQMYATEGQEAQQAVITIATVTYNAVGTLRRTLQSVAQQTYPYIEHLIVDGRSTDHTLSIIQDYVNNNTSVSTTHNIRLMCEPDRGLYDAMNKALALAKGDYIIFLNAGDTLPHPETISQLDYTTDIHHHDLLNPGILYGPTEIVNNNGNFLRHRRLQAPERLGWTDFRWGMLVCHQAFYVRTDIAKTISYDLNYRFSADFDWCIRIMKYVQRRRLEIVNSHQVLCNYLSEGMTTANRRSSLIERFHIMKRHFGTLSTVSCHIWFVIRAIYHR